MWVYGLIRMYMNQLSTNKYKPNFLTFHFLCYAHFWQTSFMAFKVMSACSLMFLRFRSPSFSVPICFFSSINLFPSLPLPFTMLQQLPARRCFSWGVGFMKFYWHARSKHLSCFLIVLTTWLFMLC